MIQINNLNFSYSKKKQLFSNLNLELKPGKIYGLLGKNGTGKSTLLKLITGGLSPNQGIVKVDDKPSFSRRPEALEQIFFLPEEQELPAISISAYLNAYKPFYPKFDLDKFNALMDVFEIEKDAMLADLSYGQKKKVLISFGMATNVRYLIMDEPTNGLDIPSKSQFRKALLKGFRDNQIVIISTHQIRDLDQLIEAVIILEKGSIVFNKDVYDLQDKLLFTRMLSEEELPDLIYREGMKGSYVHIQPNTTGRPSEVELELLFNAVIQDVKAINQHL